MFRAQAPLVLAILAAEDGDLTRTRSILSSVLDEWRRKPFEETLRIVAKRLAIVLEPL
jgi:hypothetical protein